MTTSRSRESLAVLIVDGNQKDCEVLKDRLRAARGWSLSIEAAVDGECAMRLLKERFYDLVFLACDLSDGEGLPLLDRIRQLHAKSAVVATGAKADTQLAVAAMKKGALDWLTKSDLPRTDLGLILRRLMETRNLINQNMELHQVNEMKNAFIANVSHEVRTPLTVILGYARTLQEGILGSLSDAQKKAVDSIVGRSEEMLGMLNRILRVREAAEGRQLAALKPADLCELWRASAKKAAPHLKKKRLVLETAYPAAPVWVMADAAAFSDVCANLLSNAIKFSPEGGLIRLTVGCSAQRAWTALQDQGAGIAPELMPRIFEDFSAASSQGLTREHSGLGLGLSLSKQTVDFHSGCIWLESPGPGQGCIAHVSLPLAKPDLAQTTVERPAPLSKRRVLIVEDNPDLIDVIRLFVSGISGNLELATAHSGFEALDSIKNQVPHLIILDLMMPGMNGLELLARLRRASETSRVPVLILTGYSDAAEHALAAGAQEVLIKPFERTVFVSKVLQLLQQAEPAAKNA